MQMLGIVNELLFVRISTSAAPQDVEFCGFTSEGGELLKFWACACIRRQVRNCRGNCQAYLSILMQSSRIPVSAKLDTVSVDFDRSTAINTNSSSCSGLGSGNTHRPLLTNW